MSACCAATHNRDVRERGRCDCPCHRGRHRGSHPSTMRVPGPLRLAPGVHPGGVVVHAYALFSGRMITCDAVTSADDVEAAAVAGAASAGQINEPIVLVAFDGDTGLRLDWPEQRHTP